MTPFLHSKLILAQATAQQPSLIEALLGMAPLFLMIMGVFYFLYQRPMQKEQDAYQKMLKSILKGDAVVTIGGIHGEVGEVHDKTISLIVSKNTTIVVSKTSIKTKLTNQEKE